MAKNIQEFVVEKVKKHIDKSNVELNILRHIFTDDILHCLLCKSILVPVDKNNEAFKEFWICPCEFCYIDDFSYRYSYGSPFERGLGSPYCSSMYCKMCVEKIGYNNLFVRYAISTRTPRICKRIKYFEGSFHDNFGEKTNYNMCKQCNKNEDED